MCHSTGLKQQSEQIEKFVENGMPKKIIKNVNFILNRKKKEIDSKTQHKSQVPASPSKINTQRSHLKCPFNGDKATNANQSILHNEQLEHKDNSKNVAVNANINVQTLDEKVERVVVYVDALALCTQWTKTFVEHLNNKVQKLQSSKLNTVLTKTTQPAHIVAFAVITIVLVIVGPDLLESSSYTKTNSERNIEMGNRKFENDNTIATIFYLGAFATHFGSQIWMTFVSGLSLYFSLPRHTFGQCQQILFPKYFALNAMLSILMLVVYIKYFLISWTLMNSLQVIGLSLSAFIEVTVRLYLAPPMLRLMHEKYKIEDTVGSGNEIGNIVQGDLVQCPHYLRIHKMFRRIHMTIAIGNMTVLMCTCLNLYFLASKIKLS